MVVKQQNLTANCSMLAPAAASPRSSVPSAAADGSVKVILACRCPGLKLTVPTGPTDRGSGPAAEGAG